MTLQSGGSVKDARARAWRALEDRGLLLETDAELPSVTTIVTGGPVRGSWWAHPRGRAIFAVSRALTDHPDVAVTKLLKGKVTFVHRRLWPALAAVGGEGAEWQTERLGGEALLLWWEVQTRGEVRSDLVASLRRSALRPALRTLESRLLVQSEEVHTAGGAHAKVLHSWEHWCAVRRVEASPRPAEARRMLEAAAALLAPLSTEGLLPWEGRV